jgi:hypothetical protein
MENFPDHLADVDVSPPTNSWDDFGWGEESLTEDERVYAEESQLEKQVAMAPALYQKRDAQQWDPVVKKKFDEFQKAKGYEDGSCDLTLIGDFIFGRRYSWLPQKTGSCVVSNTYRPASRRMLVEILLRGQLEELLGRDEFGPNTISFYAPLSYGIMRELGNLRGGDGGFCSPMIESLMRGCLDCNNGRLNEILTRLGATGDRDYPEPQSNAVYRKFQNWSYNNELSTFLECPLVESVKVTNRQDLVKAAEEYKPTIMCSMTAIKRAGTHAGLTYFVEDRGNQWAHCMSWQGRIFWGGREYDLLSNESWKAGLIYPIPAEETESIFRRRRPECLTLGEFDMKDSKVVA